MTKRHTLVASLATALMIVAASGAIAAAHDPGTMGQGYHMGPGMMGPGYGMMDPGQQWRMGPEMMRPGSGMGPGYGMGPGMMGPGYGAGLGPQPRASPRVTPRMDLSIDDVRSYFEDQLAAGGNARLKVGKVEVLDDDSIEAQIVTVDDSLVASYRIDRHTGAITPAG